MVVGAGTLVFHCFCWRTLVDSAPWPWKVRHDFLFLHLPQHWYVILPLLMMRAPDRYSQALTTATFALGKALDNKPINILGCVMTCLLIVAWFVVFIAMIRAVVDKDILWPQKQEDRAEGGWQVSPEEKQVCDPQCWSHFSADGNAPNHETMQTKTSPQARMVDHPEQEGMEEKDEDTIAERDIDEITRGKVVPRRAEDLV